MLAFDANDEGCVHLLVEETVKAFCLTWGLALLFGTPVVARAACPSTVRASAALVGRSNGERIEYLRGTLRDQDLRATWWNWGFATFAYSLAATQFTLAGTTDKGAGLEARNYRAFLLVNASRSTLAGT